MDAYLRDILERIATAPNYAAALAIVQTVPSVYLDLVQPFRNEVNRVMGLLSRK
jgi:Mg2+ and Co2+ transporter CorA